MPLNTIMVISPWQDNAIVRSPDGLFEARIDEAYEIAMGGPTSGVLLLSNGVRLPNCNPSMVWSADSRYLAVPQWTKHRMQRLAVVSMITRAITYAPGDYSVLQLERFADGVIVGIDSPIHEPRAVAIRLSL